MSLMSYWDLHLPAGKALRPCRTRWPQCPWQVLRLLWLHSTQHNCRRPGLLKQSRMQTRECQSHRQSGYGRRSGRAKYEQIAALGKSASIPRAHYIREPHHETRGIQHSLTFHCTVNIDKGNDDKALNELHSEWIRSNLREKFLLKSLSDMLHAEAPAVIS